MGESPEGSWPRSSITLKSMGLFDLGFVCHLWSAYKLFLLARDGAANAHGSFDFHKHILQSGAKSRTSPCDRQKDLCTIKA